MKLIARCGHTVLEKELEFVSVVLLPAISRVTGFLKERLKQAAECKIPVIRLTAALGKLLHSHNKQMAKFKYGRHKCRMSCAPGTARTAAGVPAPCVVSQVMTASYMTQDNL